MISIVGVVILAITVIAATNDQTRTSANQVLSAVLPLLGTWVGTVMAYYFTREAQQSGANIANQSAQRTPAEALSTPATARMIKLAPPAYFVTLSDNLRDAALAEVKLDDLLVELEKPRNAQGTKWYRVPVIDYQKHPVFCVHRNVIDQFRAAVATDPARAASAPGLSLKDLYDDKEIQKILNDSIAAIAETATLADAKTKMSASPYCQDVFVTKGGTTNEEALGWITDDIITNEGKV